MPPVGIEGGNLSVGRINGIITEAVAVVEHKTQSLSYLPIIYKFFQVDYCTFSRTETSYVRSDTPRWVLYTYSLHQVMWYLTFRVVSLHR